MCTLKDKPETTEQKCCYCKLVTAICFIISICLLVGGFLTPPQGVIDGSVLAAVGELLIFPVIVYGFRAIELGMEVKISKGNTTVEIHNES
jgi:sugar phosphate permease